MRSRYTHSNLLSYTEELESMEQTRGGLNFGNSHLCDQRNIRRCSVHVFVLSLLPLFSSNYTNDPVRCTLSDRQHFQKSPLKPLCQLFVHLRISERKCV